MILSVLDLSPVTGEATQADAVRDTLEIAKADAADAATVHGRLADKAREAEADEIFVMATGPTLEARIRSLELIADAHRSTV